ncbi:MAG: acyltransferase, partial [Porphyrobacter sp.]|nr:acyltransferase [Porphyrobacter sp.]
GLGALCALYLSLRPHADWNAAWRRALGLIGLGLIAYAALAFDENTPTPSSYTLLPTVGAALIILCASPANLAGKLLGSRVPVAIGLVSYSLYLWHQPIFVFGRHLSLLPPGNGVILIEYVALACVAWLSWRFVECPFRRKGRFTRKQVFAMAGAASVVLFTIGLIGHFTEGSFGIRRDFEAARRLDMRFAAQRGLGEACVDGLTSSAQCRTSDRPEILVWGDSFAMHLIPGLLASRPGARIEQATAYTCGPVLGLAPIGGSYQRDWAENCIRNNDRVLAHLKATPSIKYVLMGTIFSTYVDSDWGWRVMRRDGSVSRPGRDGLRYFLATIHEIRKLGGEPVLVSPPPQSGFDLAHCTELAAYRRLSGAPCDFPLAKAEQLQAGELALLHRLEHEARVIWLTAAICPNGVCQPRIDDTFIYADNAHLTAEGSTYLGRKLDFYGYLKRGENAGGGLPQP